MTERGKDVRFLIEEARAGERRPQRLQEVLNGPTLELLEQKGWGVSIATIGLENPETADKTGLVLNAAFKNHKNIPVTLWIVRPGESYWTDPLRDPTLEKTKAKIAQVESWANYYGIPVSGIGLDIEPTLEESQGMNQSLGKLAIVSWRRAQDLRRMERYYRLEKQGENPFQALTDLIDDLKTKGLSPEAYIAPEPLRKFVSLVYPQGADTYTMAYTCSMPDVVARLALRGLLKIPGFLRKDEHLAFGNVSTTGVDSGVDFGKGNVMPSFGTPEQLIRDIHTVGELGGDLSRFRVFALTGSKVLSATMEALETLPR